MKLNFSTDIRYVLNPSISNFEYYGANSKKPEWKNLRKETLEKYKFTCCYCGGIFRKYLFCFSIDPINQDKLEIACRICYAISHLNLNCFNEVELFISNIPQKDICVKTINHIINYDEIPAPNVIDQNIKIAPISILEFINILIKNNNNIDKNLDNYKIFLRPSFDTAFLDYYKKIQQPLFLDETDSETAFKFELDTANFDLSKIPKHVQEDIIKNYLSG